jgi:hypothetical protein
VRVRPRTFAAVCALYSAAEAVSAASSEMRRSR